MTGFAMPFAAANAATKSAPAAKMEDQIDGGDGASADDAAFAIGDIDAAEMIIADARAAIVALSSFDSAQVSAALDAAAAAIADARAMAESDA